MKRLVSITLALAMVLCLLPTGVFSITASAETSGYYTYSVTGGKAAITNVSTQISGDVTIPPTLGGYPVTSIGDSAFSYCRSLTSITVPDSVTSVGYGAFENCTGLRGVYITDLAAWCNISFVTRDGGFRYDYTSNPLYYAGNLYINGVLTTNMAIPDGVTEIGEIAFCGLDNLVSVTFPNGLKKVDCDAFFGCTALNSVYVSDMASWCDISFSGDGLSSNPLKYAENLYVDGVLTTDVVIPEGVTQIKTAAFYSFTAMKSVVIPSSVKSINSFAFSGCTGLNSVKIADIAAWCGIQFSSTNIHPFYYADDIYVGGVLTNDIVIPEGVTRINDDVFQYCNMTSITIPKSVTSIGQSTFLHCSALTDVWYAGDKTDRALIAGHLNLANATWHYNICSDSHSYSADCDVSCNECEWEREVLKSHIYAGDCDNNCNECGALRDAIIEHTYAGDCDEVCDVCSAIRETSANHFYTNTCDTICNVCGNERAITHAYDNACDADCNVCGDVREVEGHKYDNDRDPDCNVCGDVREVAPPKSGWILEDGLWAYYTNGVRARNKWMQDSQGWCYLGADGYMLTDEWVKDSVGWCYVGADGYCVTNCWKKDSVGWCYLDANGRMATNQWIKDSVGWCYVGADGYCVTNCWKQDSVGWCYLDANGRMVTNQWIKDSVGWCYVGVDGYCVTNCWKKDSVGWCYLDKNGRMVVSNWVLDGGKWYYCDGNGYMLASTSRYIGGKTYHFNASGVCTNP